MRRIRNGRIRECARRGAVHARHRAGEALPHAALRSHDARTSGAPDVRTSPHAVARPASPGARLAAAPRRLAPTPASRCSRCPSPTPRIPPRIPPQVHEHLRAGDSYEICLTTALRCADAPPPLPLYRALRTLNPAPYAAFLRCDPARLRAAAAADNDDEAPAGGDSDELTSHGGSDGSSTCSSSSGSEATALGPGEGADGAPEFGAGGFAICCSSPECFLRVAAAVPGSASSAAPSRQLTVESKPIKGTAPRGATPEADLAVARALAASEKDRAENLMIVDLIRNDLGRVCANGSVHVPSLMAVESFATVHQLVSTIRGELGRGVDALDATAAAFPPGSMTGAPKIRTMRLIDELECSEARGPYSGALGFFSAHGAADLNVVIRTAVVSERGLRIGAGGAVVAMSDADDEWGEVLLKARTPMRAVAACVTGDPDAHTLV